MMARVTDAVPWFFCVLDSVSGATMYAGSSDSGAAHAYREGTIYASSPVSAADAELLAQAERKKHGRMA
jgi:hypothetical protein